MVLTRLSLSLILVVASACGSALYGQSQPSQSQQPPSARPNIPEETILNPKGPCIQPPPIVRWEDYKGPFDKVVGAFGRKLERKSVHTHFKPGAVLCSLETKDKFVLFLQDTFDPITFAGVAFNAGIDQAENAGRDFGPGAVGYARRFRNEFLDQASGNFFKDFAYPAIFSEDPRYYRLAHGTSVNRLLHALAHSVVAYNEDGNHMFNFSEWLGTTSSVALADLYNPNTRPGVGSAAQRVAYGVATDAGFDVLREFWPEIARKLKLPFRQEREPEN